MFRPLLACFAVTLLAAPAWSQGKIDLKDKTPAEALKALLPAMGAKDIGGRFAAQQQWQAICVKASAPGKENERLEVCKLMADNLGATVADEARIWLLKQLEFLGRGESVDAIDVVIGDKNERVQDAAIRALANNPAKEATTKLAARVPFASGTPKLGLINALGFRADPAAAKVLAQQLNSDDILVVKAAARALSRTPGTETAALLLEARASAKDAARPAICDAYLICADRLLADGKIAEAAAIYKDLNANEKSRPIRLAALQGVIKSSGDGAGQLILDLLAGKDDDGREIALTQLESINSKSLATVAGSIDKLPPQGQVLLIGALAARGEKSQSGAALTAAKSKSEPLQKAGILALGKLGDASVVPFLIETAFTGKATGSAAKESLAAMTGDGIDEKIIAAFKSEKATGNRVALINILESRRSPAAVPVLIEEARGDDAAIRSASMNALRKLAEPKDAPTLVPALLKSAKGGERNEAEKTIVTILARIPEAEKRADVILPLVNNENRIALLPVLGGLGGPKALEAVRVAVATDDKDVHLAGLQALINWPDGGTSEDLIKIVKAGQNDDEKAKALRGLIRVNSLSNEQPAKPRLAMLKQAFDLSTKLDDKKLALEAIGTCKDIDAFRYAAPMLDDKELSQAACKAVVELAHSKTLREPNVKEFHPALDHVIKICRDKTLVERAKKYKAGG